MDWDDLRFLLAVQRNGSLSAAARALGVNQTTVGRRLDSLEARLGSRLVARDASGYTITDAGHRACDIGKAMEQAAQALEREVGGRDTKIEGSVRVTAPGGFVPMLAPALARLQLEHPRLHFHLITDVMSLNLVQREAEVAVRMMNPGQPSLLSRRLGELPWALYASAAYIRRCGSPSPNLAGHYIIGFDETLAATPGGKWFATHAGAATVVARVNNVISAMQLAASGMGIAAAPSNIGAFSDEVQAVLRPAGLGSSTVFLVTHRDLAKLPRVKATLDRLAIDIRTALAQQG